MSFRSRYKEAFRKNMRDPRNWLGLICWGAAATVYSNVHAWMGAVLAVPLAVAAVALMWGPAREWNQRVWKDRD